MSQSELAAMLVTSRSAGVAPQVNVMDPFDAGKEAHKQGIHPDFEIQDRRNQKPKTMVPVVPQKGLMT